MSAILTDPALQASVVPFATALALTLVLRLAGSAGPALAAAAIGCGVFATHVVILGLPPWPPVTVIHKLGALMLAGIVVGVGLDLAVRDASTRTTTVLLLTGFSLAWLGWGGLTAPDVLTVLVVAGGFAAASAALPRLVAGAAEATESAVVLLVAGAALAIVGVYGAVASLGQLAGGLAAAAGGFALVNWLRPRHPFGAAALLAGGGLWFALATAMALFSDADLVAIVLILPAFFARPVAGLLPLGNGALSRVVQPVAVGAIAAIPAIAAVGVAALMGGGPPP